MKDTPGLGKAAIPNMVNRVNVMAIETDFFVSLPKNGSKIKNNDIGMLKYCAPPQHAFASPSRKPPNAAFGITYLPCSLFDRGN